LDVDAQRVEDYQVRADLNDAIDSGLVSGEQSDQRNGWFALGWVDAVMGRLNR
jgi:hypothetical protein